MPHLTKRALAVLTLPALMLSVAVAPLQAQAETAATAPEIRLFTVPNPGNAIEVAAYDESAPPPSPAACIDETDDYNPDCYDVGLNISGTEALTAVTVTAVESEGLYVDPPVATYDTIGADRAEFERFAVRATTTGLHTLTFEVTAAGAEPRRISLPYVWRAGGAPIDGDDSLAGRTYVTGQIGSYPCAPNGDCTFRYSDRVSFANATRTSSAPTVDGMTICGPKRRCPVYHYDRESGLLQIGRGTIGRVTPRGLVIGDRRFTRVVQPRRGQRLDGLWLYGADVDEGRGIIEQLLRLRSDGSFRLSFGVDTHRYPDAGLATSYSRVLRGRYTVGLKGRLTLTDPRRGTRVATLSLGANAQGHPRPYSKGVQLSQTVKPPGEKSFVDGNLLTPLPI